MSTEKTQSENWADKGGNDTLNEEKPRLSANERERASLPVISAEAGYRTTGGHETTSPMIAGQRELPKTPTTAGSNVTVQNSAPQQSETRPLNVKDALSYLELVKHQFTDRPEVYDQYLAIMKEFKAQSITIPEVIEQVSTLFHDYPHLIEGFNNFLPLGYRVKGKQAAPQPTPNATSTTSQPPPLAAPGSSSLPPSSPALANWTIPGSTASPRPAPSSPSTFSPKPQVDFNYAIAYMNKVKARFPPNSGTYLNFLSILRTYQKEQKTLQEVRQQVSQLFVDAPDLLEEFKLFLPDNSTNEDISTSNLDVSRLPPVGNFTLPTTQNRERRPRPAPSAQIERSIAKRSKLARTVNDVQSPCSLNDTKLVSMAPYSKFAAQEEEVSVFSVLRKHLGDIVLFHRFLELLHMFREKLIDKTELLNSFSKLVKNEALTSWFAWFIHWNNDTIKVKNVPVPDRVWKAQTYESVGVSYRKNEDTQSGEICSGRDSMCNEVLNDTYLCVTNYSAFLTKPSHYENQYAEALQLVEDERCEYDWSITIFEETIGILSRLAGIKSPKADMDGETELNKRSFVVKSALKKLYGQECYMQVYSAVLKNPPTNALVVIRRLKEKHNEWTRHRREWKRVWGQVERNNYKPAMNIRFCEIEGADRRNLSARRLIKEIDDHYQRQKQRIDGAVPGFQFTQILDDHFIFLDVLKLCDAHLSSSSFYSYADKGRISAVLKALLSQFFGIPLPREALENELNSEAIESVEHHRDGLSKIISPKTNLSENTPSEPPESQPVQETKETVQRNTPEKNNGPNVRAPEGNVQASYEQDSFSKNLMGYNFFGNSIMYLLFRLISVCYDRLYRVKLALQKKTQPNKTYEDVLANCIAFLKGSMDASSIQKYLQSFNNEDCCTLSSLERIMKIICYRIHEVLLDPKLGQLLLLFESDGANSSATYREQMIYRNCVEAIVAPESKLYNMRWYPLQKKLCIQQLLPGDTTQHEFAAPSKAFTYYVDSYAISLITEGVDFIQVRMPFLRSSLQKISQYGYMLGRETGQVCALLNEQFCKSNLQLFFSPKTYTIFFEPETENVYINSFNMWVDERTKYLRERRTLVWRRWLNRTKAWKGDLPLHEVERLSTCTLEQVISSFGEKPVE